MSLLIHFKFWRYLLIHLKIFFKIIHLKISSNHFIIFGRWWNGHGIWNIDDIYLSHKNAQIKRKLISFPDSMTMLGQRWPMVVRARWPNIIKKALAQCNFAHRPYVRPTCWFYVGPSCWPNNRPTCRPYVGPTLPHGCTCTLAQHHKKGVGPM